MTLYPTRPPLKTRVPRGGLRGLGAFLVCAIVTAGCLAPSSGLATKSSDQDVDLPVGTGVGQRGPDFTLESLAGGPASLSDYRGRPVVINFFASWCGPCIKELPMIEAAYARERSGNLAVLLLNLQEDRPTVQRFASRLALTAPILLDVNGDVFYDGYRVLGLPSTFFLDRAGVVRARVLTELTEADLEAGLAAIR